MKQDGWKAKAERKQRGQMRMFFTVVVVKDVYCSKSREM